MASQFDELPQAQRHLFVPWQIDALVCARCGQLPQAHPTPETFARMRRMVATSAAPEEPAP